MPPTDEHDWAKVFDETIYLNNGIRMIGSHKGKCRKNQACDQSCCGGTGWLGRPYTFVDTINADGERDGAHYDRLCDSRHKQVKATSIRTWDEEAMEPQVSEEIRANAVATKRITRTPMNSVRTCGTDDPWLRKQLHQAGLTTVGTFKVYSGGHKMIQAASEYECRICSKRHSSGTASYFVICPYSGTVTQKCHVQQGKQEEVGRVGPPRRRCEFTTNWV